MNDFNLDLAEVSDKTKEREYSSERTVEIEKSYREVKAKFESGTELTLEDQRVVIQYARSQREEKFILKPEKERKVKKLARAALILLLEKPEIDLTENEIKDRDHTLAVYKGKKLTKKALNLLLIKEHEGAKLNLVEVKDKELTLFGD